MGKTIGRFWRQLTCRHDFRLKVWRKVHNQQENSDCCPMCGKQVHRAMSDAELA